MRFRCPCGMEREVPERLGGGALIAPCEERCLVKFDADQPAGAVEGEKARIRAGVGFQNQPAPTAPHEVTHGNPANAACSRTTRVELEYGVEETKSVPCRHAREPKRRVRRPGDVPEVTIGDEMEDGSPIRCDAERGRMISWAASLESSRQVPTSEHRQHQGEHTNRGSHFHDPLLVQKACPCYSAPDEKWASGVGRGAGATHGKNAGARCDSAHATVKYCADATPLRSRLIDGPLIDGSFTACPLRRW